MTRSKLSNAEKQEMAHLFQDAQETLATLAQRYGVSSSTVRRVLKTQLPEQEYETLVSAKQGQRNPSPTAPSPVTSLGASEPSASGSRGDSPSSSPPQVRSKLILRPKSERDSLVATEEASAKETSALPSSPSGPELLKKKSASQGVALEKLLAEIEDDFDELDLDDDDLDEDELEEDDLDDDDLDEDEDDLDADVTKAFHLPAESFIRIRPLSEATISRPCYLVVDRAAELITCPLQSFGELGQIPEDEVQAKTLPVFENHRVARRFSHRSQRIIKVPNGNVLKKTCVQLHEKGITRVLINGHVYAL